MRSPPCHARPVRQNKPLEGDIMRRSILVSTVMLFAVIALAACQTPAGRSAGEVVDDASITTQVKAKLLEDDITRGLAVSVQTFGGTVTLIGAVDTKAQIERAGSIAASVKGVKGVDNRLKLKTR